MKKRNLSKALLIIFFMMSISSIFLTQCQLTWKDDPADDPNGDSSGITVGADDIDPTTLTADQFEGGWVWNDWTDENASYTVMPLIFLLHL